MQSVSPLTGEVLETFDDTPPETVDEIVRRAATAFHVWRKTAIADRAAGLRAVARVLRTNAERYARTMAREMGKPVVQGEAEIEKCAVGCEFYAEHGETYLAPEPHADRRGAELRPLRPARAGARRHAVELSLLAGVPLRGAGAGGGQRGDPEARLERAALRARHRGDVPRRRPAGRPVPYRPGRVAAVAGIVGDPRVRGVTLTGSDRAGSEVAAHAGRAIKKTVLELGGSDPFVVLEDADIPGAARTAADARLVNSGQSCIAAKRFIVVEAVADRFLELFVAEMGSRRVGDPLDRKTQVGPLARHDLRDELHAQVEASTRRGARCVLGGRVPDGPGAFYPPTVLTEVRPGMAAFDEETFGPVAAVTRARDESEAIALANTSAYGLGASLWTRDRKRAERLAAEIDAGSVFVNGQVKSDPRLPFGGVKRSGYGRELSEYGIREFVQREDRLAGGGAHGLISACGRRAREGKVRARHAAPSDRPLPARRRNGRGACARLSRRASERPALHGRPAPRRAPARPGSGTCSASPPTCRRPPHASGISADLAWQSPPGGPTS